MNLRRLEPEQEIQLNEELIALEPVITAARDEYVQMREQGMAYVSVIGVVESAIEAGDTFDHLRMMITAMEKNGCTHVRPQLLQLVTLFFMLGRKVEQAGVPLTPTFWE